MSERLPTQQLPQVGGGTATAIAMTRCQWCAGVFDANGGLVDPRPKDWGSLPKVACQLCARLERISTKEPNAVMPMTREELANAGVVRKGTGRRQRIVSVQRTLEASGTSGSRVEKGRSCLPVGDRD